MTDLKFPDRPLLEEQARRLLERARSRSGASVDDMVRTIGSLQPRGAGTRRSWYDWQDKPETISLLTGLAAMHVLGSDAALDVLFGEPSEPRADTDRVTRIERRLEGLLEVVARLQEASDNQRKMLEELIRRDMPTTVAPPASAPSESR